ncbi:MAG: gamma-glutamylcyclotransferase [Cyanobacteria bacterium QS_9_48_30]|nr:MAG: gamma-glutamylcyclotransferase [Cyanobacteria bacterium QS_9_48_30]
MSLTRAALESELLQELLEIPEIRPLILNEAQMQASIRETLEQRAPKSDIWVFACGSLIWNPLIKFVEHRVGTVNGWHRQFCLWTPVGRGTSSNPGLVLGLEPGGSCGGVAYRIAAADIPSELLCLWRREMIASAYIPRWIKVFDGIEEIEAIAFTVNPHHPMYVGELSEEAIVNTLASATGSFGSSADYFMQTVSGLRAVGIQDELLFELHNKLLAQQKSSNSATD